MTITNGYTDLTTIKGADYLNISDSNSDTALEGIITTISRAIDNECNRYFYKSSAHEVRYFTARDPYQLFCGDVVSVTALYTDTSVGDRTYPFTWQTTDYDLFPYNESTMSEPEPYRWLDKTPLGTYQFPVGVPKGVKLDAIFGWNAVPSAITRACLLWSMRWFKRLKTPLGVAAASFLGETTVKFPPPDPDVMALLSNYKMTVV